MKRDPIIQVEDLVAGYGEEVILNDISFEVFRGEIFVILGGSGCGKSTLLKHLIGLLRPLFGHVIIDHDDMCTADDATFQKILRKIGVLYQGGALFSSMTLTENIALPVTEFTDLSPDLVKTLVRMKLNMVSLSGYENRLPSELSGGMRKRAALARAMALNPKILFFDEPSAGLDPVISAGIDELIIRINRSLGTTMVIVTHDLESIFTLADRVIMLDKQTKGIIAEGDPKFLRDHSQNMFVRNFFNRHAENTHSA